ncbi:MAG: DUF87 domain-containing protein [Erysipelotrichaceae bacterium]|nr:DUF87 domain-containing protein [Erysipelotrichaceae bacterium]
MAKKKQRKKKQSETFENELITLITALILVVVSLIGILRMGVVGEFLSSLGRYLAGTYSVVIFGVLVIYALFVLFKKSRMPFSLRTTSALAALLIALVLWSAVPSDSSLSGFAVLKQYVSNTAEIFQPDVQIPVQGGLLGALIYSVTSALFAKEGTLLVIGALIVLALILLIRKEVIVSLFGGFADFFTTFEEEPVQPAKKQKSFEPIEADPKPKSKKKSIFISSDEALEEPAAVPEMPVQNEPIEVIVEDFQPILEERPIENEPISTLSKENSKAIETGHVKTYHPGMAYRLPPFTLLEPLSVKNKSTANQTAAQEKGKRLLEVLANFGIQAQLIATHIGPSVTKFEIRPDSTVKVNRIHNISDNLKMELQARDIRIEAPIPGRNAVGVEIPNVETTMVKMLELVRSFPQEKKNKKLTFILGKDLMGRAVYCDLDKMPHLLIAGATGSGKSVCMNTIITSFLLRTKPEEVRLLLIDPKKVEFTPYHKIPHLIGPVISDGNEAARALKVVVAIMENRYEIFSTTGVRNITAYNEKIKEHPDEKLKPMEYIVVIIDELADLMAVAGKEVEMSIQRITQLARAAGIHLIVATQRPSTDVITGIIKANIPSRIAFAVSSGIDSRTILDGVGAERLLGYGDMLYLPIGEPSPIRLQGVYVTDDEVRRIAEFVSSQAAPFYEDAFIRLEGVDNNEATAVMEAKDDPLYDEIKEYVIDVQKASTSLLQRRFGLGYNRAARMIDVLEDRGIIGPAQGSKPREVYIKKEG